MNHLSLFLLLLSSFSAAAGQVLFKIGAHGREQFVEFFNMPIALGLLMYGIGTTIWIYVLSYEKLVNVYAFTVLTFAIVHIGAVFIVGERITMASSGGIVLILSGLYLISYYK